MLDPDLVLNSILASLQSIPQLAVELGAPTIPATDSITGHFFYSGEENSLMRSLSQMKSPSITVAYLDLVGGNFDGMTVWKHRVNMYLRPKNKASNGTSASAQHLYWLAMNLPISVPQIANNIRSIELADFNLQLMDTPTLLHHTDELGQDFFVSTMVFPEKGDVGPSGATELCIGPPLVNHSKQYGTSHDHTQRDQAIDLA
ncbi:MAG TPA: hypothetical protein VIX19_11595 [Terriglobales bacterium]